MVRIILDLAHELCGIRFAVKDMCDMLRKIRDEIRMANLIHISDKQAYGGDLTLHREIEDYVRRTVGDWEDDE